MDMFLFALGVTLWLLVGALLAVLTWAEWDKLGDEKEWSARQIVLFFVDNFAKLLLESREPATIKANSPTLIAVCKRHNWKTTYLVLVTVFWPLKLLVIAVVFVVALCLLGICAGFSHISRFGIR